MRTLLVAAMVWSAGLALWIGSAAPQETGGPLSSLGMKVSIGAAPGYVEDRACALCHREIFDSYQDVGMARSFYRPSREKSIEDFDSRSFHHQPSDRYYQMSWRDDRLIFRRYQLDDQGSEINAVEIPVDWVLGSGHTSRTYLFRTGSGELYQLPLAWYSQTSSWQMAPGFGRPRHLGLQRLVRRECMFCHNGYPDVPEGSDRSDQLHVFPADLPEGTGCQRCHGPGAEHARGALTGKSVEDIRSSIIHPGRLAPKRRDDICYGCHLQPTVLLSGIRRFDRQDYSFRPGQRLSDYIVHFDIAQEGLKRPERFEINHHPYRLRQSACYLQSKGQLSCVTCHDPHRKVPVEKRAAHYRDACLSCHATEELAVGHPWEVLRARPAEPSPDDGDSANSKTADSTVSKSEAAGNRGGEQQGQKPAAIGNADCVSCHMPRRRTQDVVHVVMTDHLIQRRPAPAEERLGPLEETSRLVTGVDFLFPDKAPAGNRGQVYRAAAVLKTGTRTSPAFIDQVGRLLAASHVPHVEPYLHYVSGLLQHRRYDQAASLLEKLSEKEPGYAPILSLGAAVSALSDSFEEASAKLRTAIQAEPRDCRLHYNLGSLLRRNGRPRESIPHLRKATDLCFNLAPAWLHLGQALDQTGRPQQAVYALRRGLAVDPSSERLYLALAEALRKQGNPQEARRYLRHGLRSLPASQLLREALKKTEGASGKD